MDTQYQSARAFASNGAHSQEASQLFERDGVVVVALADGGGGMRAGVGASRDFVKVVAAAVEDATFPLSDLDAWLGLFRAMDTGIASTHRGETTGVLVAMGDHGIVGVSTGNSGAWMVTPTTLDDLTASQYTRQRLGSSHATPTVFERSSPTGVLLVASDGLFKFASPPVIVDIVRVGNLADAAQNLVSLVRQRSGKVDEDVTVMLARRVGRSAVS